MNTGDYFDYESSLAALLKEGILFCNDRYFSSNKEGKSEGKTIVLFVIANDIFYPAANAEDLKFDEVPELYYAWTKDKNWGVIKWLSKKRNLQPRSSIRQNMKKDNVWEDWLDKLELPEDLHEKTT